ncbi:MAG: PIN domain-containing protein [Spirochaetales bacterium]|nr:PIN domain-containing protein [Spirochaetales bacterium]
MIIVDTNIIIDYLKKPMETVKQIFSSNDVAICGITETELIHGIHDEKQIKNIIKALSHFKRIKIEESLWFETGKLLPKLKKKGISVPF